MAAHDGRAERGVRPRGAQAAARRGRAQKTAAALELVGLQDFGARRPSQLSGGQQQRVALARTIAIEPKVLLLDEPLSNLDAKLRVHMRTELLALQRKLGITTIFVTHDQEEALSISDRVAVLDRGVIQQVGTPMDLFDRPANRFIASFVGTINLLRGNAEKTAGGVMFDSPLLGKVNLPGSSAVTGDAEIAFRPHTLILAAADSIGAADKIWIDGSVAHREFLGEFIRYRIDVQGTDIVADQPHYGGNVEFVPGSQVRVGIEPAHSSVLRRCCATHEAWRAGAAQRGVCALRTVIRRSILFLQNETRQHRRHRVINAAGLGTGWGGGRMIVSTCA